VAWIIVVSVIGGLFLLGILVLSIPLDLEWRFEIYGKAQFHLRWSWLFGILEREFKSRRQPSKKTKSRGKFNFNKTLERLRKAGEFMYIQGLLKQLVRFAKRSFRCLKIKHFEAEFNVGLDDPAETFYLFALTEPVNRILEFTQPYPVRVEPSFIKPAFEGYFEGNVRLYPVQLIPPALQMIFSSPTFRVIRKVISLRWRKNR
jgi:hypothetical protein